MVPRARVLYFEGNTDGTIGGSYFSLLYLAEGLDRSRFEPRVLFRADNELIPRFQAADIPVHVVPRPPKYRSPIAPVQSAENLRRFAAHTLRLRSLLLREQIDLVHLNNSITRNHDWMIAAHLSGIPCITHERGINDRYSTASRWHARRLAAVICISGAVRDALAAHRIATDRLTVIHNGLDPARVEPRQAAADVRRQYGIAPGRPVIGMVGNLRAWKGQEIVIRAMPEILKRTPDVMCLLVGATAPAHRAYEQHLRQLIAELHLDRHVMLTGYHDHPADVLDVMDVAILASIDPEPFGRVLLEAMALKKPVVASRGGAVPEIVGEGTTGYTFTPGDASELAARVLDLLTNPARIALFGAAGYERLCQRFHVHANVRRTMELYDRTLARRAATEPPPE